MRNESEKLHIWSVDLDGGAAPFDLALIESLFPYFEVNLNEIERSNDS